MSLGTQVRRLRTNKIIAPGPDDSIGEVYVPLQQDAPGGAGVDDVWGAPVTTAAPETPNARLIHLFTNYCRVRKMDKGKEESFGGESSAVSQWKISFRYYLPDSSLEARVPRNAIIRIQRPLRTNSTAYAAGDIVQPAAGNPFYYVCAQAGTSGSTPVTWPTPASDFDGGAWAASTAFPAGATIRVGNLRYRATVAGTTGSTLPVFPATVLGTVTDGGVTWRLVESVADGTAVWQVAGELDKYEVVDDSGGKTYGVLLAVTCTRVNNE